MALTALGSRTRSTRHAVAVSLSLLGVAPAALASPTPAEPADIRLERVISTGDDLARRGLLRWITGKRGTDLFQRPYGITWHEENLLVTDPGAARVVRVPTGRGKVVTTEAGLLESPIGIVSCNERILVTDSVAGAVAELDSDLQHVRWLLRGLERPTGLACAGDRVFVAETGRHRILVLDLKGNQAVDDDPARPADAGPDKVAFWGGRGAAAGEFNFPTVVGLGLGSLWIGDTLNFRLQRFDPETNQFLGTFGRVGDSAGEMPRLKGLAVDVLGNLWISDAHLDQVSIFTPEGAFLATVGHPGSRYGEFSFPAGIASHASGRIAVADSLNRRIQIFRVEPSGKGVGR
jgi:DNA-binding beta-propeller fold protein YncE